MFNRGNSNKNDSSFRSDNGGDDYNANDNYGVDSQMDQSRQMGQSGNQSGGYDRNMGQGYQTGGYDRNMGQSDQQPGSLQGGGDMSSGGYGESGDRTFSASDQNQKQYGGAWNYSGDTDNSYQYGDNQQGQRKSSGGLFSKFRND